MTASSASAYGQAPTRPLKLGRWDRISDWWDARRNAAATPARPDPEDAYPSTPRLEAINHHHRDAIQGEWLAFLKDTHVDRILLARLGQDLLDLRGRQAAATAARDELAGSPVDESARPGEEHLSTQAVSRRRRATRGKAVAGAEQVVASTTRAADAVARDVAEAAQRIQERRAAAQSRSIRIHERDSARVDRYRSVLCRRHPDGLRLNSRFTSSGLELPQWVGSSSAPLAVSDLPWAA